MTDREDPDSKQSTPVDSADSRLIVVSCGGPSVQTALPTYNPNRLAVLGRTWEHIHVFNPQDHLVLTCPNPPNLTLSQKLLAHTIYNPRQPVETKWERVEAFEITSVVDLVDKGLEEDDDIIQQWFEGDSVLRLLRAAESYEQLVLAVEAICGAHEVSPEVNAYAQAVLGEEVDPL